MATCKENTDEGNICSICLCNFNTPKALPCLHTFCLECLQSYINKNFDGRDESFFCPICRVKYHYSSLFGKDSTISIKKIAKHLPTNFYISSEIQPKGESSDPKPELVPQDESYFTNLEQFEKQIYDYKMKTEQQCRRNMIWGHTLKQNLKLYPRDNHSTESLKSQVEIALTNEYSRIKENHHCLDKSLLDLEKIKEETVSLITPKHQKRKLKTGQKKQKTSSNSSDIKRNLNMFKSNLEIVFQQLTISDGQNELKTLMDQMQLLWMNPDWEETTSLLKIMDQDSDVYAFPMVNEFLYICNVNAMDDDTIVICGKSPSLLLCYDANSGLLKSRFELCDEPSNMSVFNETNVMVTFMNKMRIDIINVSCHHPLIVMKVETKILYPQVLYMMTNNNINTILGLHKNNAYHVLQFSTESVTSVTIKSKGYIPDRYPGSQVAYIKQRDIVLYPDKNRKHLQAFCLSSKQVVFKYDGDIENPLVVISDVCCSESFIFITDKRHHKVHKVSFYGKSLDIIHCHDFGILWPLHIDVNKWRTMVICSQKKDSSYVLKTFLF